MEKEVKITIVNEQKLYPEGKDRINQQVKGNLFVKNGVIYLHYDEIKEGLAGASTTIKLDQRSNRVMIIRRQPARMKQVFIPGKKTESFYQTAAGNLEIAIKTEQILLAINDEDGTVRINYNTYINQQLTADNRLKISYKMIN